MTLALLALDPFLQAVVLYEGRLVDIDEDHGTSTISRATKLDIGDWEHQNTMSVLADQGNMLQAYTLYPDIGMSATSLIGFVNTSTSNLSQPPGVSCRTGNCTWSVYSSLGLCNTCSDISEYVFKEESQGMPVESEFSRCQDISFSFFGKFTSYIVPYNAGRRLLLQQMDGTLDSNPTCAPTSRVALSAVFRPSDTYRFKDSKALLTSFAILELSPDYWNNAEAFENSKPKATECAFEFCALAYEANMRSGHVAESVLLQSTERSPGSFKATDGTASLQNPVVPWNSTLWRYLNASESSLAALDVTAYSHALQKFTIMIPRDDLQVELPPVPEFPKNLQRVFNISQKSIAVMMDFFSSNSTLESITYALSDSTNMTATFNTAARLISNRMREVDGTTALGVAEQWTTYTVVRWNIFAFPVIVLVTACTFTLIAVFESSKLGLETMKTSLLATLIYSLDAETRRILREEKKEGGKCSDTIDVKLEAESDGLVLRHTALVLPITE